jgi:hypothetical protein
MTPGQVSYAVVWEDVLAANRLRLRPTRRRRFAWAVVTLFGAGEIALSLSDPDGLNVPLIGLGLFSLLAYAAWWLVVDRWLLPRLSRRYYNQAAVLHEPIIVAWSVDGLSTRSPMVTTSLPWSAYIGRREDDATLLLFQTDMLYQFIPKRVLDEDQVQDLRSVAASVPWWRR